MKALLTEISYCGQKVLTTCDHRCEKAWGINGRSYFADRDKCQISFDDNEPDDIAYPPDHEVGDAPRNPGTYEGGQGKPMHPEVHNKWCVRECERCEFIDPDKPITVRDFSHTRYNMCNRHPVEHPDFNLGRVYTPSDPFESGKAWFEGVK